MFNPNTFTIVVPPIGEDDGDARAAFVTALLDAAIEDGRACVRELDALLEEADELAGEIRAARRPPRTVC